MSAYWNIARMAINMGAPGILQAGADYLKTLEEEKTQREWIRANHQAFLAALRAEQETLLAYFEKKFAERRETLQEFYAVLHHAVETGNDHQLDSSIAGILGIIRGNPLLDYAVFKKAFEDPDTVIEI